jgi:hypothetical protein
VPEIEEENEMSDLKPVCLVEEEGGKKKTTLYASVTEMVFAKLEELGDVDIYEIRDVILPRIIKAIEH